MAAMTASRSGSLVLAGAVAGGAFGVFAFLWLSRHGYYGLIVPGGCVGLGAGIGRARSRSLPMFCAALALMAGLYAEWRFSPFIVDNGWAYFLTHVAQLPVMTLCMIGVGALIGFWVPFRRGQDPRPPPSVRNRTT
jgi:hypothetical protein